MKYILHPGIVRAKICGQYLLIPDRMASEEGIGILKLNLMTYTLFEAIERGDTLENLYKINQILTKKPMDYIVDKFDKLINGFCEKGYLIAVEEDE